MENLVIKKVTYKSLRKLYNSNEEALKNLIYRIESLTLQKRLLTEAKKYWAKIYDTSPVYVHYGDITDSCFTIVNTLPFEYVIGNIDITCEADMSQLKGVMGNLTSKSTKNFPNLESVSGTIDLSSEELNNIEVILPKLTKCKDIDISFCTIKSLALIEAKNVNMKQSIVKSFKIQKLESLNLAYAKIKDITSLEKADFIDFVGVNVIDLKLNPELIFNKFNSIHSDDDQQLQILRSHLTIA